LLLLSTAKIWTPGEKAIQDEHARRAGIEPDLVAPDNDRQQDLMVDSFYEGSDEAARYKSFRDRVAREQMEKATEVLSKLPAKKAA
jgi:hypothetical protein